MENCTISGNSAPSSNPHSTSGGGVAATNGANLTMLDCVLLRNFASKEGGGLAFFGARVRMERCRIVDNHATFGGGLILDSSSFFSCIECAFLSNNAVRGAGVYIGGSFTIVNFIHCDFAHNVASEGSGAALYISSGTLSLVSSNVVNNTGSGSYFILKSGAADG